MLADVADLVARLGVVEARVPSAVLGTAVQNLTSFGTVVTTPSRASNWKVLPLWEGPWVGPYSQKPLHPSLHGAGRGNPRIVKARSSHGISHEHE